MISVRIVFAIDHSLDRRLVTYVMIAERSYPDHPWLKQFVLVTIFLFCYMTVLGYFVALADIIPSVIEFFRHVGMCLVSLTAVLSLNRMILTFWQHQEIK